MLLIGIDDYVILKKVEIFQYVVYRLDYELDDPEFKFRERQQEFLFKMSNRSVGHTKSPIKWTL